MPMERERLHRKGKEGERKGKEERRRQKKGIWGRRPRLPHAQTAMKLPSSCFYCLSALRSEPESSRREKGEGRREEAGRAVSAFKIWHGANQGSPTRGGKGAKGSGKVAQRVKVPAAPSPFAKSAWKQATDESKLAKHKTRLTNQTSKRARSPC